MDGQSIPAFDLDDQITKHYTINSLVKQGNSIVIYDVIHKKTGRKSILKICHANSFCFKLETECKLMKGFQGVKGIPKCYRFIKTRKYLILQIERFEVNLYQFLNDKLSIDCSQVIQIGISVIQILRQLHSQNIIHRNITPQNIMINSKGQYFLIGLGRSYRVKSQFRSKVEILQSRSNLCIGSSLYASFRAHCNRPPIPADDIESLLYTLIFLIKKKLPWTVKQFDKKKKNYEIGLMKQNLSKKQLCQGLPSCFLSAFESLPEFDFYNAESYDKILKKFVESSNEITRSSKTTMVMASGKIKRKTSIESAVLLKQRAEILKYEKHRENGISILIIGDQDRSENIEEEGDKDFLSDKMYKLDLSKQTNPKLKQFVDKICNKEEIRQRSL